ncbi:MAG: hypothetical protein ACRBN8_44370 [Nannocystales bacterium]
MREVDEFLSREPCGLQRRRIGNNVPLKVTGESVDKDADAVLVDEPKKVPEEFRFGDFSTGVAVDEFFERAQCTAQHS